MPITTRRNPARDITTFECDGDLSFVEIVAVIERFIQGTVAPPTTKLLWDIRTASIDNLSEDHVSHIANLVINYRAGAKDTKIAILISEKFNSDIAKKFKAKAKDVLENLIVFRKIDEATKWLKKDSA
ncbi:MAG: hypothetical protein JRE12_00715 [Deltaproteobacteria bacterium]|nr:hypothetical protein [Deltaproteobacteria bacterium]